jgi:hypothetical protein
MRLDWRGQADLPSILKTSKPSHIENKKNEIFDVQGEPGQWET